MDCNENAPFVVSGGEEYKYVVPTSRRLIGLRILAEREWFLPESFESRAGVPRPFVIGCSQNLRPHNILTLLSIPKSRPSHAEQRPPASPPTGLRSSHCNHRVRSVPIRPFQNLLAPGPLHGFKLLEANRHIFPMSFQQSSIGSSQNLLREIFRVPSTPH